MLWSSISEASTPWQFVHPGGPANDALVVTWHEIFTGGRFSGLTDELVVVRHDRSTGEILWKHVMAVAPGNRSEVILAQGPRPSIYAASRYEDGRGGPYTTDLARLDTETGSPIWSVRILDVGIRAIVADARGDLLAAGSARGLDPSAEDLIALKLSASTGQVLWRTEHEGSAPGPDQGNAIATDGGHEIYVAGSLFDQEDLGYADFAVLRLDADTGAEIWRNTIPSLSAHGGKAVAIELNAEGDPVVAGHAVLVGWCDFTVGQFDRLTGNEVWRYFQDIGGCDRAASLDIDLSGNIVVTAAYTIFSVLKLSATGNLLWRHDVPNIKTCTGGDCAGGVEAKALYREQTVAAGNLAGGDFAIAALSPDDGAPLSTVVVDAFGCQDNVQALERDQGHLVVAGSTFMPIDGECAWPSGGNYLVMLVETSLIPVPTLAAWGTAILAFTLSAFGARTSYRRSR